MPQPSPDPPRHTQTPRRSLVERVAHCGKALAQDGVGVARLLDIERFDKGVVLLEQHEHLHGGRVGRLCVKLEDSNGDVRRTTLEALGKLEATNLLPEKHTALLNKAREEETALRKVRWSSSDLESDLEKARRRSSVEVGRRASIGHGAVRRNSMGAGTRFSME